MKEGIRTLVFVGVALVSGVVAWFVHAGSQSEEAAAFAKIGTEFYPDFDDPTQAGSLEIIDYDERTRSPKTFKVEFDRGRWRIPSHHGYPADAAARLEKAAASLIGITREALAGRRENEHERFGVIEPPDTQVSQGEIVEGLGQRIILKDKNGGVLADYLLGNQIAGQDKKYFVRKPEDEETYRAEVQLDVSTRFSDWIEKDLLKLDRSDVLSMERTTPQFELRQTPYGPREVLVGEASVKVHRPDTGTKTKWQIAELNLETEEINTHEIRSIQTGLDGLELNGVRPKPQGLTADLGVDREVITDSPVGGRNFMTLRNDLKAHGFHLVLPQREGSQEKYLLFGEGGEVIVQSNEGLVYHLHFGKAFAGNQEEIEVGKTDVADEQGNKVPDPEKKTPETAAKDKTTLNRYLFVRVEFDENLLGKVPVDPKEPEKPAGLKEESSKSAAGEKTNKTLEEIEQDRLRSEYASQMALYRNEKAIYEEDIKEYREKLKVGKAKAAELNTRFEDWYYVIPETSHENVSFSRADVVKIKEKEEPEPKPTSPMPGTNPLEEFIKNKTKSQSPKPATAEKPKPSKETPPTKATKPD